MTTNEFRKNLKNSFGIMIHALGPNEVNKHWKEFYPEKCRPHLTKEDWIDFMQILEKINKDEKFSNW